MTRQVTFACNIARPQPGKRLGNGHPAPTGHPCRPTPLDLPASRQANQSQAQHSAGEPQRAETAGPATLTVTFTARKSPVQATSHARQPAPTAQTLPSQSPFLFAPNGLRFTCAAKRSGAASGASACWACIFILCCSDKNL